MANERDYFTVSATDLYYSLDGVSDGTGWFFLGYYKPGPYTEGGAFRFPSVPIGQGVTVNEATLHIPVDARAGSSPVMAKVYGIKEANTAPFGAGVNGRPRTTAFNTHQYDPAGTGWFGIAVTGLVNEILAQPGWASGNAMGFYVNDNGTSQLVTNDITTHGSQAVLSIRVNPLPNFFPNPKNIAAPTFPAADDYGMKISMPGVDVKTATEQQLYFTTRKDVLKVVLEGVVTCTANVETLVPHGLSYIPQVVAFGRTGGSSVKVPRFPLAGFDPIVGGIWGKVSVDATYVRITVNPGADVYYYIFLDEQAL